MNLILIQINNNLSITTKNFAKIRKNIRDLTQIKKNLKQSVKKFFETFIFAYYFK